MANDDTSISHGGLSFDTPTLWLAGHKLIVAIGHKKVVFRRLEKRRQYKRLDGIPKQLEGGGAKPPDGIIQEEDIGKNEQINK